MTPLAKQAMTEKKSFSMTDTTSAESDTIANTPEKIVRRKLPAKPMTFKKVLLTIDSILKFWIEESDDLRTLDCDSSGVTMNIDSDVSGFDMVI